LGSTHDKDRTPPWELVTAEVHLKPAELAAAPKTSVSGQFPPRANGAATVEPPLGQVGESQPEHAQQHSSATLPSTNR